MATVRTDDGVTLHYRVAGSGPTSLLFVHGFAQSGYLFDSMIQSLDLKGLRCITMDLRGHGDSDKATSGYTRDRIAKDIWTVADAVEAKKFVVVGFSAGGRTAQYLTCQRPERVQAQVLLSGTPTGPIPLPKEVFDFLVGGQGDATKMEAMQRTYLKAPVSAAALDAMTAQAVRPPRVALEGFLNVMCNEPFYEQVASIRAPTLAVGGGEDPFFSPHAIREGVAAPIRHARTVILPETGHYLPVERPGEVARLIEAFVAGLGAGA